MTLHDSDGHDLEASDVEHRARSGDRHAIAQMLEEYRPRLVGLCRGYLRHAHDAEDAAQDVSAKLLTMMTAGPGPEGSLRAWLYSVARNHCLNLLRRDRISPIDNIAVASSQYLSQRTGPATGAARAEHRLRLHLAMASLAPELAEVLFLRYFESLKRSEIATILGISDSSVKWRLNKARSELGKRIGDSGSAP